jgi:hypothetical protein
MNRATLLDDVNFWVRVQLVNGCWLWIGSQKPTGYGLARVDGRTRRVHQVLYQIMIGEIPEGLELDHTCRNPSCINPTHLEPVTHQVNMSRGRLASQTHCVNGHEYTPENTYIRPKTVASRDCRICRADRVRKFMLRRAS